MGEASSVKKADFPSSDEPSSPVESTRLPRTDKEKIEKLFKRGESCLRTGKDEDAIKCFVQILALDALHYEAQNKLAILYLQKQMYSAAAALFKQLSDSSPDPVHFSHLGFALFNQNDYENAKVAYQKALELDPSRPQRFVSLSQVYRAAGELQHAVIALNKALELDKENLEFLFLLADTQAERGNKSEAFEILSRVLEIDPQNEDAKSLKKALAEERGV